jgi:hypothetical protein
MKSKVKARELINNFLSTGMMIEQAKQCALITVDEIINSLKITLGHLELRLLDVQEYLKDIQYYQEVKKEIQKL